MIPTPTPMQDPCSTCEKAQSCLTSETYKCDLFRTAFIRAWDETTAWFRQQLQRKEVP